LLDILIFCCIDSKFFHYIYPTLSLSIKNLHNLFDTTWPWHQSNKTRYIVRQATREPDNLFYEIATALRASQ